MKKTKFTALLVSLCMLVTQITGIIPVFASSISVDNGAISIDWEGESTNATLITVSYDDNGVLHQSGACDESGALYPFETYDVTLYTGTNYLGPDYLHTDADANIRVMLWDSLTGMRPLMESYLISKSDIMGMSTDDTYPLSENNNISTMSSNTLSVSYSTNETTGTGVITIDTPEEYTDSQKTLMVLKPGTDKTKISLNDIIAIDQGADISKVAIPAISEEGSAGVYTVLMGGTEGNIYTGTFSLKTITFSTNGGDHTAPIIQSEGTEITLPVPTRDGYTFDAWYTNYQFTQKYEDTTMPSENITLYAKWNANKYTITFETNGGNDIEPITEDYETYIELPTPKKTGYSFEGWYSDEALTQKYESNKMPKDITLYAKWIEQHNIVFETNGGTALSNAGYAYGETILLPIIEREGYVFEGWYADSALTEKFTDIIMPDKDITLYAKWNQMISDKKVTNILIKNGFEEIENCNTVENGNTYAVMPALVNGDSGASQTYEMEGITLVTSSRRAGDESSYFKLDTEDIGSLSNNYITTTICRFANSSRGSRIKFNGDSGYNVPENGDYLVFVFNVKMQDGIGSYDTAFKLGNVSISRSELGIENNEWAQIMAVYSNEYGVKVYKVYDGIGELLKTDFDYNLCEMSFDYPVERKSEEHPYGYPLVSFDNMSIYTVPKLYFGLQNLSEIEAFKGRINAVGNISWNGNIAQWDSIEHAASYDIELLRNGKVVKAIDGITETSYDFSEILLDNCAYRVSVVAVPDEDIYYNSIKKTGPVYSKSELQIGDYVQMGTYYDEPILWRCIDVDENGPLLVTDKILCVKAYDAPGNITTGSHTVNSNYSYYWGDSNLRCWLNSDAEAGKVVWTCGNPPSSKALNYDAYDGEAGFLSNFSATEKYVINPVSRNKGEFTDKVTLLDIDEVNIFNCNKDILGADYKIGILSDKAVENSEYLKTISRDFDVETQTEIKYDGGDKYDTYLMPYEENGVGVMTSSGYTGSGGSYCGVRPAIHIKDDFEMSGDGSEETPYSFIDDVAAKVSLPENDVTPKIYDIIKIPVSVSENTGFASAAVSLSYDTDKYTFISVTPSSSLLGATITKSETNDGVNILAVNPSNITGDGTIFTVNLMVNVDALNTTSEITVKPVEFFDENQKLLVIDTGNAKMQSILSVSGDIDGNAKVNSADAVLLSQYLAKYQSSSLSDTQKNNADVYTDSKINIKDMYVLSQYIVNNLTSTSSVMSLFAEDNPKLSVSAKYADNDNSMIDVTFSVKDNSGFTSFLFEMGFDKTRLTPVSITSDDVLKNESITSNVNETGVDLSSLNEVTALLNKSEGAVESDGKLYTVRFKINGELADDDVITFKNSGFISKVNDIQLDAPTSINLKEALNTVDEPQNEVSNLKADAGDGQVTLSWDKNDNALAYVIYQDGAQKQTVLDTSCIVTGLNNGTQYTFTVKILSSSGMSEGVSVTAVPLLAIPPSDDNVHITYNNGTANILSDYGLNNVVVIFAEYDSDDVLVSVESKPVTVAAGASTNYSKDKVVGDGNKVKVMLWNSLEEMQPLHSVVE